MAKSDKPPKQTRRQRKLEQNQAEESQRQKQFKASKIEDLNKKEQTTTISSQTDEI